MVCILFSARLVSGSFPLLCEQWEMAGVGHDGRQRACLVRDFSALAGLGRTHLYSQLLGA